MHDLRWIREAPEAFDYALGRRGLRPQSVEVLELDRRHREAVTELQDIQTRRKEVSKAVGDAKRAGKAADALIAEVKTLKIRAAELEEEKRRLSERLDAVLSDLPNAPAEDVPDGPDESANVTLREVGEKPAFDFELLTKKPYYVISPRTFFRTPIRKESNFRLLGRPFPVSR